MNKNNKGCSGGALGTLIAIVVLGGGLVCVRKLIPAIFKLALWGVIAVIVIIILIIVLIVVLANKSGNKSAGKGEKNDAGPKEDYTAYARKASGVNPSRPESAASNLTEEQKKILQAAREKLMDLRRVIMAVHQLEVRDGANGICGQLDSIIQTLREKPEKITPSRQCLNYYIPTLISVLTNYSGLDAKGQLAPEMHDKTLNFLADVQIALKNHYDSLFDADKMDMEVDMEAMTIALKRDGLLDGGMQQEGPIDEQMQQERPIDGELQQD